MPKVSIIVPVYNVEKYLDKCLNSLVNQTLKDIEIIIVNDGSTDNSKQIIEQYATKYNNLIKVVEEKNQGLGAARNNGLKFATSDYIIFVDSDDYVETNMVEELYNKILEEQADFVICGNNVVTEDYKVISKTFPNKYEKYDFNTQMIFGNLCAWNKIIKKTLLEDDSLAFRSNVWYEDIDVSFKLFLKAKKMCILPKNLYNYLFRQGSIMNSKSLQKNLDLIAAFDEIIKYSKQNGYYDKYYKEIEFLAIDHLYISCAVRIITNKTSNKNEIKKLLNVIFEYMNKNFNNYSKNKYLKLLSKNRKLIFYLIKFKLYYIIRLIFMIRKAFR